MSEPPLIRRSIFYTGAKNRCSVFLPIHVRSYLITLLQTIAFPVLPRQRERRQQGPEVSRQFSETPASARRQRRQRGRHRLEVARGDSEILGGALDDNGRVGCGCMSLDAKEGVHERPSPAPGGIVSLLCGHSQALETPHGGGAGGDTSSVNYLVAFAFRSTPEDVFILTSLLQATYGFRKPT